MLPIPGVTSHLLSSLSYYAGDCLPVSQSWLEGLRTGDTYGVQSFRLNSLFTSSNRLEDSDIRRISESIARTALKKIKADSSLYEGIKGLMRTKGANKDEIVLEGLMTALFWHLKRTRGQHRAFMHQDMAGMRLTIRQSAYGSDLDFKLEQSNDIKYLCDLMRSVNAVVLSEGGYGLEHKSFSTQEGSCFQQFLPLACFEIRPSVTFLESLYNPLEIVTVQSHSEIASGLVISAAKLWGFLELLTYEYDELYYGRDVVDAGTVMDHLQENKFSVLFYNENKPKRRLFMKDSNDLVFEGADNSISLSLQQNYFSTEGMRYMFMKKVGDDRYEVFNDLRYLDPHNDEDYFDGMMNECATDCFIMPGFIK